MRNMMCVCFLLFIAIHVNAQKNNDSQSGLHISHHQNKITCGEIDAFYLKLARLEKSKKGQVSVVQIGDSHTQPDFISSIIRNAFQQKFGDAGRGIVFPYQLAKSNAPLDINSSSSVEWKFNRLTHPEIDTNSGVSGFVLETASPQADLMLNLKDKGTSSQLFNRLKLFMKKDSSVNCTLIAGTDSILVKPNQSVQLSSPSSDFILHFSDNRSSVEFYGASLENGKPGVLYHNIGINGARYDHYNITRHFWEQLPSLKADLYIVSLGTNEAQKDTIDLVKFDSIITEFVKKIHETSPGASLLITTAADSFKGTESNGILKTINTFLYEYCEEHHIAFWDLYSLTNGYGSAKNWFDKGLMNKDRIHYLADGYRIHGNLLLECLLKGYDKYKKHNPKIANK